MKDLDRELLGIECNRITCYRTSFLSSIRSRGFPWTRRSVRAIEPEPIVAITVCSTTCLEPRPPEWMTSLRIPIWSTPGLRCVFYCPSLHGTPACHRLWIGDDPHAGARFHGVGQNTICLFLPFQDFQIMISVFQTRLTTCPVERFPNRFISKGIECVLICAIWPPRYFLLNCLRQAAPRRLGIHFLHLLLAEVYVSRYSVRMYCNCKCDRLWVRYCNFGLFLLSITINDKDMRK